MSNEFKNTSSLFAGQIDKTIAANTEHMGAGNSEKSPTYCKDGLLYCAICNMPKQKNVPPIGVVNIDCDCTLKEREEKNAAIQRKQIDDQRKIAFGSASSIKLRFTFQTDDQRNPLASQQIAAYVEHFSEHRQSGKGLLLYSLYNGGGKTFLSSAAANALIDRGYSVRVTKFADLRDEMTDCKAFKYLNKRDFLLKLCAHDLIVIDDLGAENDTQYTNEIEYRIIDELTDNHVPLIITTNYTPAELSKVTERAKKRINDRILGNCIPIKIDPPGKALDAPVSRRIERCKQNTNNFYHSSNQAEK